MNIKKIKTVSFQGIEGANSHLACKKALIEKVQMLFSRLWVYFANYHLNNLDKVINKRRENASIYCEKLNNKYVLFNESRDYNFDTFHTFVIQVDERDALRNFLESKGVGTSIHYPIPIHLQPAASYLNLGVGSFPVAEDQAKRILTLPVNQYVTKEEINFVASQVNAFFG